MKNVILYIWRTGKMTKMQPIKLVKSSNMLLYIIKKRWKLNQIVIERTNCTSNFCCCMVKIYKFVGKFLFHSYIKIEAIFWKKKKLLRRILAVWRYSLLGSKDQHGHIDISSLSRCAQIALYWAGVCLIYELCTCWN